MPSSRTSTRAASPVAPTPTAANFATAKTTASACLSHLFAGATLRISDRLVVPVGDVTFGKLLGAHIPGLELVADPGAGKLPDLAGWNLPESGQRCIYLANPDFGRDATGAVAAFNRAAQSATHIAMIVPASFHKPSLQRRLAHHFHFLSELPLSGAGTGDGSRKSSINLIFQLWEKRATPRAQEKLPTTHADFSFLADPRQADFAIRRVGARAGAVIEIPEGPLPARGLSPSSNYFVRVNDAAGARVVKARMARLDTSAARAATVAVPSVSKAELVALYAGQLRAEYRAESVMTEECSAALGTVPVAARLVPATPVARQIRVAAAEGIGLAATTSALPTRAVPPASATVRIGGDRAT